MNVVFFTLIAFGIIVAAIEGNIQSVTVAAVESANAAVERVLNLIGIITLWLGLARVAEKSGILNGMTRLLFPLVRGLFPSIPKGHPAMGNMLMNMSANILGLGNAATPFGLKAMEELQKLNKEKNTASEAMCTFLALNTSSLTVVPATIIGIRVAMGSESPSEIVVTTLMATAVATVFAVLLDYLFRKWYRLRREGKGKGRENYD